MSELGETSEARELVPGAPEAVYDLVGRLRRYGAALEDAGENLRRISAGDWTGAAAAGFQDKFAVEPARWLRAADAFTAAAGEVDRYADVLAWAQAQAREAIARYAQGEQASAAAQAAHRAAVERAQAHNAANAAAGGSAAVVTVTPFVDPGEEHRAAARDMLARARAQLADAGAQAAAVVARERDAAPEEPSWLDEVGSFLGEVGKGAWESTLGLVQFAAETHPARLMFDPDGYWDTVTTRAQGAVYAVQHPVEFGKAVLDWDTWKTNPGRAIGHLVPDAVLAAATAGTGAAALRSARAAKAADDLPRPPPTPKPTFNELVADDAAIGRPAPGHKKFPVREVRTRKELDALFEQLGQGGIEQTPATYKGKMYTLDDGSTVGYRYTSSSSPEPTIDINTADGQRIKVHVNPEGW